MHSLCPSCFHWSGCLNKACRRIQVSFAEFTSHLIPFSLEHHALSYNTGAKSLSAPCTFISCSGVLKHRIVNTNQFLYIHTQTHTDYIYSTFYSLSFKPTAISMTGNMPVHDNMSYHSPRLRFALTLKAEVQLISAFFFFSFLQKPAHTAPPLQQFFLESCSEPVVKVQKQMASSGLSDSTPAFQQCLSLSIWDDSRQLSIKYWLYLPLTMILDFSLHWVIKTKLTVFQILV